MAGVTVIGGANVDIKGRASGGFVGATSNPGEVSVTVGGVGRNIADNLARLEVETALFTVLGDDANGRLVREACTAAGVDLSLTLTGPVATGTYLVILDHRGELQSAINDMRNIEWLKVAHLETAAGRLRKACLLVADCNVDHTCLEWLCRFSVNEGIPLVIEPVSVHKAKKLLRFRRQEPVFAITPNRQQLEALTDETNIRAGLARLHALGFENIIVHLGSAGAIASSPAGQFEVAAIAVQEIADVTGAGDAAVAGFVCGRLDRRPLPEAARLGQAAASIKLTSRESVAAGLSRDRLYQIAGFS